MPVYLDCNASTPVDGRVIQAVCDWMTSVHGNASSVTHHHGNQASELVHVAKCQIADQLTAKAEEVLFTSGATESNNLAILGLADHGKRSGKLHLLASGIEHSSVLQPLRQLESEGFELQLLPVKSDGRLDAAEVAAAVRDDTLLVCLMLANNVTGVIQPVAELAEKLADRGTFLHVDAALAFGHLSHLLVHPAISMISISGHKIYGPPGIGALVARQGVPLKGIFHGGGRQVNVRPGSLPVPLIAGLGLAAELAYKERQWRTQRNLQFGRRLWRTLESLNPIRIGAAQHCLENTLCVAFPQVDADMAVHGLRELVSIGKGAASAALISGPSSVLMAMGLDPHLQDGALRFSWCHETPELDLATLKTSLTLLHRY